MTEPLVSCVCPTTAARSAWLPQAIECFSRQTYRNRELVIVSEDAEVYRQIPERDRIQFVCNIHRGLTIGDKRNLTNLASAGAIICHWDDDDFSAPGRIEDQVHRLLESGRAVTGYHSMRFTDGAGWWRYRGAANYALGTSLCYRREWWREHPFASLAVEEDNQFVRTAADRGELISTDAGDLMHATIHPGNTSKRNLSAFEKITCCA